MAEALQHEGCYVRTLGTLLTLPNMKRPLQCNLFFPPFSPTGKAVVLSFFVLNPLSLYAVAC